MSSPLQVTRRNKYWHYSLHSNDFTFPSIGRLQGWYTFCEIFMSVNPDSCLPSLKRQLSEMGRCVHVAKSDAQWKQTWVAAGEACLRISPGAPDQQPSPRSESPTSVFIDLLPLVSNPFSNSSSVILPFLNFFKSLVSLRSSSMSSSSISEP